MNKRQLACDMSDGGAGDERRRRKNVSDEQKQNQQQTFPGLGHVIRSWRQHRHQHVRLRQNVSNQVLSRLGK